MSELVTVTNGELVTSTLVIAEGAQNSHEAVIKLVRKYQKDLEEVGNLLRFEIRAREEGKHGGGDVEYALLNEPQTTLLFTFMQNTEIVRAFKVKLVKAFYRMRDTLQFQGAGSLPLERMLNNSPTINGLVDGIVGLQDLLTSINQPRKVMDTRTVKQFLSETCALEDDVFTTKNAVYNAFADWCRVTGSRQESKPNFFAKLYRCHPAISQGRVLVDGIRTPIVTGIALEAS